MNSNSSSENQSTNVYHCPKCDINTHNPCPICGTVFTEKDRVNLRNLYSRGKPWGGKPNTSEPSTGANT